MKTMNTVYQQTLHYGEESIPYAVIPIAGQHTRVRIHVSPAGIVEVEAPEAATKQAVHTAVQARAQWISQHLRKIRERKIHILPREYISGESHFYLGRRYMLKVIELEGKTFGPDAGGQSIKLISGKLVVQLPPPKLFRLKENYVASVLPAPLSEPETQALHSTRRHRVKILLRNWYREHAEVYFSKRIAELCQQVSWLDYAPSYRLQVMRKQWGSCSPVGVLLLNPHLIKAPRRCIDYVLVHEICHLREHNHSPAFYRLLEDCMPDWQKIKEQLDGMAELLLNE